MAQAVENKNNNENKKNHLGIVIVGHVDAGKSTTTGRLLFELGRVDKRQIEKLKKQAKDEQKESFYLARITDKTKKEQQQGITINATTDEFYTKNFHYTIIDAPGHVSFLKNMITGASQADVAMLLVPASIGKFETAIAKEDIKKGRKEGQTRQHANLCHLLGIKQIIVAVNKMDTINYNEKRFNEIKDEMLRMLEGIGYKAKKTVVIPISGFVGDNITKKSNKMNWYKGFKMKINNKKCYGFTLLDALDYKIQIPQRSLDKPLRMPISNVCKIKGIGNIICGRIEQGKLSCGINVKFYPSNLKGRIFSIEMHHKSVENAICGDNVGVNIRGLDKLPKTGEVMCIDDNKIDINPPKECKLFTANIQVEKKKSKFYPAKIKIDKTNGNKEIYDGGYTPIIYVRTMRVPCKLIKILWVKNKKKFGNGMEVKNQKYIEYRDVAQCVFKPLKPFCVTTFEECPPMGRIAAMDSNALVLLGRITEVVYIS